MKKIILAPVFAIAIMMLSSGHVFALSDSQRYMQGWFDGVNAAKNGEVSGCPNGHKDSYCNGYANGYASSNGNSNFQSNAEQSSANPTPQVTNSNQPLSSQNSGGPNTITAGSTPFQEFGVFLGPIQKHTGIYHNEQGIFIPWSVACESVQNYLIASCGSLINPDGSLNSNGDHAVSCAWNGAWLSVAGASYLHLNVATLKGILGPLAGVTGCSGIVNTDQIPNSTMIQTFLQAAGSFSP